MSRAYDFSAQKKRLIDASTLKYRVALNYEGDMICYVLAADIDKAPTIDTENLRPVGKLMPVHKAKIVNCHQLFADGCECSRCHKGHSGRNYCEECGARMEE